MFTQILVFKGSFASRIFINTIFGLINNHSTHLYDEKTVAAKLTTANELLFLLSNLNRWKKDKLLNYLVEYNPDLIKKLFKQFSGHPALLTMLTKKNIVSLLITDNEIAKLLEKNDIKKIAVNNTDSCIDILNTEEDLPYAQGNHVTQFIKILKSGYRDFENDLAKSIVRILENTEISEKELRKNLVNTRSSYFRNRNSVSIYFFTPASQSQSNEYLKDILREFCETTEEISFDSFLKESQTFKNFSNYYNHHPSTFEPRHSHILLV